MSIISNSHSSAEAGKFYSKTIIHRLSPFREQESSGAPGFLMKAKERFQRLFCDQTFDSQYLLKEYLRYAIANINRQHGVARDLQGRIAGGLPVEKRREHIEKLSDVLKRAVFLDFDGQVLSEEELKQKIEKELSNLYQELMCEQACENARLVMKEEKSVISWDLDDWVRGFSGDIEKKYLMDLEPGTRASLEQAISDMLATRKKSKQGII